MSNLFLHRIINAPAAAAGYDADAQAFITAAGLAVQAQKDAINTLVVDLKAAGVWTKMNAIYPIVGGTAAAHAYNLKDPRPVAAAFYLTYTGTVTHAATGMTFGSSYANTNLVMGGLIPKASVSASLYTRVNDTATGKLISPLSGDATYFLQVVFVTPSNLLVWDCYGQGSSDRTTATTTTMLGLSSYNRDSLNTAQIYLNGTQVGTGTGAVVSEQPTSALLLGNLTNAQLAWAHLGTSLTTANNTALNTAVQKYQTSLGRQV